MDKIRIWYRRECLVKCFGISPDKPILISAHLVASELAFVFHGKIEGAHFRVGVEGLGHWHCEAYETISNQKSRQI